MKLYKKAYLILMAIFALTLSTTSCSNDDPELDDNSEYNGVVGTNKPVSILPVLDWQTSNENIKSMQSSKLNLVLDTHDKLRYTDLSGDVTLEYLFSENKLINVILTQRNISNLNDARNAWCKKYSTLQTGEEACLMVSNDNSTLAYGRQFAGNEYRYVTFVWTYIDPEEEEPEGHDFTPTGEKDGHPYVDLGTGIGWALYNVGNNNGSLENSGNPYMWGETTYKSDCHWWYYSLYTGNVNSYLDSSKFYTPANDISGSSYDVAKNKMGGDWRMPSRAEASSLLNNCTIEPYTYNTTEGYAITGPTGKSIFIPAKGYKYRTDTHNSWKACIWTSTADSYGTAYHLSISDKNDSEVTSKERFRGLYVRGVINL